MSHTGLENLLAIGEVASATGISTDTIRVWERRYGRPKPVRLPSGHRRYTIEQVHWLKRVAEALANGARPSKVVRGGELELEKYLKVEEPPKPGGITEAELKSYLGQIRAYRESELLERLWAEWNEFGPDHFVMHRLAPLVRRVGTSWAEGELSVRHEHFVVEIVEYFLRAARLGIRVPPKGPLMLLATLVGESHILGLHMAAVVCALAGSRVQILGSNAPLDEIARAAVETGADAVGISVSLATGGVETERELAKLRDLLAGHAVLVVGGSGGKGARRGPKGVEFAEDLENFAGWVRERVGQSSDRG